MVLFKKKHIFLKNCTFGNKETKRTKIADPSNIHNQTFVTVSYEVSMISSFFHTLRTHCISMLNDILRFI